MVGLISRLASIVLMAVLTAMQVEVPQSIAERTAAQHELTDADEKYTRHNTRVSVIPTLPHFVAIIPVVVANLVKQHNRAFVVTHIFLKNRVLRT